MSRSASIAKEASDHGLEVKSKFTITPGSEQVRATIDRDGQIGMFESVGGLVLANACGPCIGQWDRQDVKKGEKNSSKSASDVFRLEGETDTSCSVITSYNRNFTGRNDANPATHAFVASPRYRDCSRRSAGDLTFNPLTDTLPALTASLSSSPTRPAMSSLLVATTPDRTPSRPLPRTALPFRLSLKRPATVFRSWHHSSHGTVKPQGLPVLIKVQGKCTTDHISAGGPG